jgi:type II secretory pathway pseudopilin PulG
MMHSVPIRSKARPVAIPDSEQGYVLLIAIFFMALLVLSLAVAAPKIAKSIQRDRELETYRRGMQFRRAIQLYYRKFQAYPPNVDALVKTNEIRFLRKKYKDPITGQDDWKPVMFGQNKTPTAMGFFGQPLAGNASTLAGIGPSGGGAGLPGAMTPGGSSGGFSLGSSNTSSGQTSSPGVPSPTDTAGTTGSGSSATSSGGPSSTGTGSASSSGPTGQTFGGAGIIGFSPASQKQSILVYKKKNHYNEWEFTYDPLSDMKTIGGGNTGTIGQPAGNTTTPVGTAPISSPNPSGPNLGPSSNPNSNPMPPDTPAPQL